MVVAGSNSAVLVTPPLYPHCRPPVLLLRRILRLLHRRGPHDASANISLLILGRSVARSPRAATRLRHGRHHHECRAARPPRRHHRRAATGLRRPSCAALRASPSLRLPDRAIIAEATQTLETLKPTDPSLGRTFLAYLTFCTTELQTSAWPISESKAALYLLGTSATSAGPALEALQCIRFATLSLFPREHGDVAGGMTALLASVLADVTSPSGSSSASAYAPLTPPPSAKPSFAKSLSPLAPPLPSDHRARRVCGLAGLG